MYYNFLVIVLGVVFGLFIRISNPLVMFSILGALVVFMKCYFELKWGTLIQFISIGLCLAWVSFWGFHRHISPISFGEFVSYEMKVVEINSEQDQMILSIEETLRGKFHVRKPMVLIRGVSRRYEDIISVDSYSVGESVSLKAAVKPIDLPTNPGQSNFRHIYYGKMIVGEVDGIECIEVTKPASRLDLQVISNRIRCQLSNRLVMGLQDEYLGMALGMATGDKSYLSDEAEEAMRNIGLSHILVVSSLHVGLLVLLIDRQIQRLRLSRLVSDCLIMLVLLLLYVISVSKISIAKCLFIYVAHLVALVHNRKPCYMISLGVFAFLALMWNPYLLCNLSFTLSLMAYVGVFYVYRYLKFDVKGPFKLWYLTLCIYGVLAPVFIMVFGGLHYIGILLSPLVMPFVEVVIALNFANSMIQYVLNIKPLSMIMNYLFSFMDMLLAISQNLGEMFLLLPYKNALVVLLFYLMLSLICIKKKWFKKQYMTGLLGFFIVLMLGLAWGHHYPMRVFYLDVGMGDGELIYQGYTSVLIDGGTKYQKQVLKNAMTFLGENQIDYGILSHEHNDHYGAMFELMSEDLIKTVYMTSVAYEVLVPKNPSLQCYRNEGRLVFVDENMSLDIFKGWTLDVMVPEMMGDDNKNNHSLMCLLKRGEIDLLFTGDAEVEEEEAFLGKLNRLVSGPVEFLKVPHHGSNSSSSKSFLLAVQANYGIISVGQGNRHGLPDDEVINRYKKMGTTLHRTDLGGGVEVRIYYPWTRIIHYKRN